MIVTNFNVAQAQPNDKIFAFDQQQIYLLDDDGVPTWQQLASRMETQSRYYCFLTEGGRRYLLLDDSSMMQRVAKASTVKVAWQNFSAEDSYAAGLGLHLFHWRRSHQHCGYCGGTLLDMQKERARKCEQCQQVVYPRISPCVIVLIRRGDEVLLARAPQWPFYSTLAGFIEPGESAEEAIVREVAEEVGVRVKNIRYFSSQPWPFPDSLMLGFTAEYAGGDIVVDNEEIADAQWFNVDNIPELPTSKSIAQQLIAHYIKTVTS